MGGPLRQFLESVVMDCVKSRGRDHERRSMVLAAVGRYRRPGNAASITATPIRLTRRCGCGHGRHTNTSDEGRHPSEPTAGSWRTLAVSPPALLRRRRGDSSAVRTYSPAIHPRCVVGARITHLCTNTEGQGRQRTQRHGGAWSHASQRWWQRQRRNAAKGSC